MSDNHDEAAPRDWCDERTYAAIYEAGRSGLAWEMLRSDAAYRTDLASVRRPDAISHAHPADPEIAARWGLLFRGGLVRWFFTSA